MTKKQWETWKVENLGNWNEIINLANDLGLYDTVNDYVNEEGALQYLNDLDSLATMYYCMSELNRPEQADYFEIDAYGHLHECDTDKWNILAEEIEKECNFTD